jgi:hypothetical protein
MSIPLLNARLCMDCDTIFDEQRCPSCDSEAYFPVSRWVTPAVASEKATGRKKAKKASMVLLGTGAALALWKLLGKTDHEPSEDGKARKKAPRKTATNPSHKPQVRRRKQSGGPDGQG